MLRLSLEAATFLMEKGFLRLPRISVLSGYLGVKKNLSFSHFMYQTSILLWNFAGSTILGFTSSTRRGRNNSFTCLGKSEKSW
jgi:hypothetical protein